ncbi:MULTISPECIES: cytochrome c3 family protein [Microbulbifer]|uniref:cytochrome c3 family protein n=1 Tax=Microbulbifer TaxID=48073 RepID=UPI001E44AB41|nr:MULTISPECIES: cytochrome c3 family protein [Microbulbifer]UHQ54889.1 cytochrome c3 family protein [Microbulbifer sp. YPW16]
MKSYQFKFWHFGLLVTLAIGSTAAYNLEYSDKTLFVSGEMSHGHHQIELACTSCHGDGFAGQEAMQQACLDCHADELELANDSHPRKKFLDPRNAPLLAELDARRCVTCHTEHQPETTREMGVTLAGDFCFHCHNDIAEERSSHQDLAFDSCASAGCHNFHDNRTLYEDFLIAHVGQPALLPDAQLPARTAMQSWLRENPHREPLRLQQADLDAGEPHKGISDSWVASRHAQAGINCSDCHSNGQLQFSSREIVEQCGSCHAGQRDAFTSGKHGMRLSAALPEDFAHNGAMTPAEARLPMRPGSKGALTCISCHGPHETDTRFAAVEACLGCHNDEHSLAYRESGHFQAWQQGEAGGVSCANCHLPREEHDGEILVNHNQNHNLRPNEKMLPVCLNCHGIEFALAALASERVLKSNFGLSPTTDHETFSLIRDRIARIKSNEPSR